MFAEYRKSSNTPPAFPSGARGPRGAVNEESTQKALFALVFYLKYSYLTEKFIAPIHKPVTIHFLKFPPMGLRPLHPY